MLTSRHSEANYGVRSSNLIGITKRRTMRKATAPLTNAGSAMVAKKAVGIEPSANGQLVAPRTINIEPSANGQLVPEQDIRLLAYQKWLAAGEPNSDGVQFWLEAERELLRAK
jgi:hypothetical protein